MRRVFTSILLSLALVSGSAVVFSAEENKDQKKDDKKTEKKEEKKNEDNPDAHEPVPILIYKYAWSWVIR